MNLDRLRRAVIRAHNRWTGRRGGSFSGNEILILTPRCLQYSGCDRNVVADSGNCLRCGRCDFGGLAELAKKHGARLEMATGGGIALELLKKPEIKAVVAVACEKEIVSGLLRKGRKPALAVINLRPHGPCRDTRVDPAEVEAVLRRLLKEG